MLRKISMMLALGLAFAAVASDAEVPAKGPDSSALGCGAKPAMSLATLEMSFLGGESTEAACCYSDPCPGWGSYMVSCCEEGCSAWSDRVWCSSTGFKYCPNPCAGNGICNSSCSNDPDCSCRCQQGRECTSDADCDCGQGFGFCAKDWEFAITGECSCYF